MCHTKHKGRGTALSRPDPACDAQRGHKPPVPTSRSGDLAHVSDILAECGLPVAEDLKQRMLAEILGLDGPSVRIANGPDRRQCPRGHV